MQQNYSRIQAEGAELIAISSDDIDRTKVTFDKLNLTYTVLTDESLEVITAYNVLDQTYLEIARPATYILNSDGTIAWISLGLAGVRVSTSAVITKLGEL